jgi:prepilin-type N-terminal cleavage/methylation domain-containing protein
MLLRAGFSIIELMLVVSIIAIIAAMGIPNYIAMQARAKEASVMEVAHTVQLAAEDYAVQNHGIYSDRATDITPLLPGGLLVSNPFTTDRTEPQFGIPAATPGQVGLVNVVRHGAPIGYTITGWGKSEQILSYSNGS